MQSFIQKVGATAVASAMLLLPVAAFAADASFSATVSQAQHGFSTAGNIEAGQQAAIVGEVVIDGQAHAKSATYSNQSLTGAWRTNQYNSLSGSAGLWWEPTSWPSQTNASTAGAFAAAQDAWQTTNATSVQEGKTWQESKVGDVRATVDVPAQQYATNVYGDVVSSNQGRAATNVTGAYIVPPFPSCHSCSTSWPLNGKLTQTVKVFVQNVLNF